MSNWRNFRFCEKITAVLFAAALIASFALMGCPVEETGYTLTVSINPTTGGAVTKIPDKASYDEGDVVTVTAKAESGYTFKNWSGASTETTATVKITMDSDKTLTANFQSGGGTTHIPDDKVRIYVDKDTNYFMVDEKRIWINGANTPWINWNEFGGNMSTANWNSWSAEFDRLKSNGINATRIWVNCSGESGSITLDNNGNVTAVSQIHWDNLEKLFDLAAEKKIYILATITSFDHFKAGTPAARWKIMIQDQSKSQTFIDKYTIPFCQKFKDNPYLWSIDIMNEPDWVWEESWGGISWNHISRFLAMNAAAIHENSEILVTVGMAYAKWQIGNNNPTGSSHAQEGNKVSDQYLQGLYNNQKAYLDFWSPHYYAWNAEWFGVTHYLTPYGNRSGNSTNGYSGGLGINSDANNPVKPAIIGECSAKGTVNQVDPDHGNYNYERSYIAASLRPNPDNSITTDYEHAFNNGWQGVMPWTSNGVDANGGLSNTQLGTATKNMESKYPTLIYPLGK